MRFSMKMMFAPVFRNGVPARLNGCLLMTVSNSRLSARYS